MSDAKAIVTLFPLNGSDILPYRSLIFTSNSDRVEIGRASKREKKNLIPTGNNGLFDSRVMSRNHARLRVCLDKKILYLSDGNSMHGTWVNGERVPVGKDIIVESGDEVVFGTEVVRGHETFPPLKVRCEQRWLESGPEFALNNSDDHFEKQTTNTFCVPDDDDDYDDEMMYDPVITAAESISESEGSDPGSESDDNSVMEISSPITTPPKGVDFIGSQQSPIDVDDKQAEQPLATPRMTPPSGVNALEEASNKFEDESYHVIHSDNALTLDSEEQSVAESSDWEGEDGDHADSADGSMPNLHSESDSDGDESDSDRISVRLSATPYLTAHQALQANTTCGVYDVSDRESYLTGKREAYSPDVTRHSEAHPEVGISPFNAPSSNVDEQNASRPVAAKNEADPSLPIQPTGKLFDHSLTGFNNEMINNAMAQASEKWKSLTTQSPVYLFPEHRSPRIPYKDGPFVNSPPCSINGINGIGRADGAVPTATATGNRVTETRATGVESSQMEAGDVPSYDQTGLSFASLLDIQRRQESSIQASTFDAVDPSALEITATQGQRLKRKAEDAGLDSQMDDAVAMQDVCPCAEVSYSVDEEPASEVELSLPDAQPQTTVPDLGNMPSQLTELCATHESEKADSSTPPVPESGRPSKRLKASGIANFRSHAATAVVGAVVGAIGTIAVLASLPADYFS
ncbi:hypothetical protein ETB97_009719 [Aspergillus alliaceus]|uniref:FHA domain-containing protein n=1 Tax=Petromyces alliaceus TaxID=209559 RepID=A0A8H6EAB2_PETAA|nr:hypothetical protein ETB97_009719 [Aspergillus burnettii]